MNEPESEKSHLSVVASAPGCADCPVRDNSVCSLIRCVRPCDPLPVSPSFPFANLRDYPADARVLEEGSAPGFVGILVSGYLRLQRRGLDGHRQILSILVPGDIAGEAWGRIDAGDEDSDYVLEASTDARICQFDQAEFECLMDESPDLRKAVMAQRMAKLDQLLWQVWSLGAMSIEQRLCAFLAIATRFMPFSALPGGGLLTIELPRADIADLLGTSVKLIDRMITRLETAGVIQTHSARHFVIPQLSALVRMGGLQQRFGDIRFPKGLIPGMVSSVWAEPPSAPPSAPSPSAPPSRPRLVFVANDQSGARPSAGSGKR